MENTKFMRSSYKKEDVLILLKDISGEIEPLDTATRESRIQSGTHYSEMLPIEYKPGAEYMATYQMALENFAGMTAEAVAILSEKIVADKGEHVVLVSLARAGTPIGILIRRYLQKKYGFSPVHYTISIIRDKGIDVNAMAYILARHKAEEIQFVDGWTGKGTIQRELSEAMEAYPGVSPELAVASDPACIAGKYGTREDFLIPSSCLNATVSGLMSRTVFREDLIGKDDFHGAIYYEDLVEEDVSYEFIEAIEKFFSDKEIKDTGLVEVKQIAAHFQISNLNFIKPGIGEATRVLLRRVPWKILVHSLEDELYLSHLYRLASEKGVEVVEYPLRHYRACGIIRALSDV